MSYTIEINNNDSSRVSKLLLKFLELNDNSTFDYLDKNSIHIGWNPNSGFSYIYLEDNPSISLCLDIGDEFCIIYSSHLDGLEFIDYNIENIENLAILEDIINEAYNLECEIRDEDYKNEESTQKFIEGMAEYNWELL